MRRIALKTDFQKPQLNRGPFLYSVELHQLLEDRDSYGLDVSHGHHITKAFRRNGKAIMGPFDKMEIEYNKLVEKKTLEGYVVTARYEDRAYLPNVPLQVTEVSAFAARDYRFPLLEAGDDARVHEVTASYGWSMQECFDGERCSIAVRRNDGYAVTDQAGELVLVPGCVVSGLAAIAEVSPEGTQLEGVFDGTTLHITDVRMVDGILAECSAVQDRLQRLRQLTACLPPTALAAIAIAHTYTLPGGKRAALDELRAAGATGVVFKANDRNVLHLFECTHPTS